MDVNLNLPRASDEASVVPRLQVAEGTRANQQRRVLLGKPAQTILLVVLLAMAPLFIPRLEKVLSFKGQGYRAMLPNPRELVSFKAKNTGPSVIGPNTETVETTDSQPTAADLTDACVVGLIEDSTHELDNFYASLSRTEAKQPGAITRVTHYGDSPITNDGITGTVRLLLQQRFGDAGH